MRKTLLASTILSALALPALAQTITGPGAGLTDAAGNVWTLTASGSIQENGQWAPGGGGTTALTLESGAVLGEDAHGRGWLVLSAGGYWTPVPIPSAAAATQGASTAAATTAALATSPCASAPNIAYGILPSDGSSNVGHIYDGNGNIFVPVGVDVGWGWGGFNSGGQPSAATLKAMVPGINFVRLAVFDFASPDELRPYINDLTSAGIVVAVGDYTNSSGQDAGGGDQNGNAPYTGAMLANELAWYAANAAAFAGNGKVWWSTNNEPAGTAEQVAVWQDATYSALRNAGYSGPILFEWAGQGAGQAPYYANKSNFGIDDHFYGWVASYSTDAATVTAALMGGASAAQQAMVGAGGVLAPVIVGEFGNSTSGMATDPNGTQVVDAVGQAVNGGAIAGFAAWQWGDGNPGDGLLSGGQLSAYGNQVRSYISQIAARAPSGSSGPTACTATASASGGTTSAAVITVADNSTSAATPAQPAATDPLSAAAGGQTVDATASTAPPDATTISQAESQAAQQAAQTNALVQQMQAAEDQINAQIQALQALIASGQAPSADALAPNATTVLDTTRSNRGSNGKISTGGEV